MEIMENLKNHEIYMKIMISDIPEPLVFPRNYLTFCVHSRFWEAGSPFLAQKHEILPILGIWSPKALFCAQNATLEPPAQNPL